MTVDVVGGPMVRPIDGGDIGNVRSNREAKKLEPLFSLSLILGWVSQVHTEMYRKQR